MLKNLHGSINLNIGSGVSQPYYCLKCALQVGRLAIDLLGLFRQNLANQYINLKEFPH